MLRRLVFLLLLLTTPACIGDSSPKQAGQGRQVFSDIKPSYPPPPHEAGSDSLGLAVILDPGHGGPDSGARVNTSDGPVCEDEIAYDIARRLKRHAKQYDRGMVGNRRERPLLRVVTTVRDSDRRPRDRAIACDDGGGELFQYPEGKKDSIAYAAEGGLATRADVITAWQSTLRDEGYRKKRIVLLSIHVDASEPHVQGAFMLYPGLIYDKLRGKEKTAERSWLSMKLSTHLMYGLQKQGAQLHTSDREGPRYLFRGYHSMVRAKHGQPGRLAIFRDVPAMPKVLLESANLKHYSDRKRILKSSYRERVAKGLLNGLAAFGDLLHPLY